jgi:hypothetical protein
MLFALPWMAALIGQYLVVTAQAAERNWKGFALNALGLAVISAAWAGLMGFFAYRAYLAIP